MLEPVKKTRLYEVVAHQIKSLIRKGTLKIGDQLPSERELAEQLNVSRTSIREALRALEMAGYLESKVGVSGGTFVREINIEQIIEPFTIALVNHKSEIIDILEVRMLLEKEIAYLAAQRRNDTDLAALQKSLASMEKEIQGGQIGLEGDNTFHDSLAKATHNDVLIKIMGMWRNLTVEARQSILETHGSPERALSDHRDIYNSILNRDAISASNLMKGHLMRAIRNIEQNR